MMKKGKQLLSLLAIVLLMSVLFTACKKSESDGLIYEAMEDGTFKVASYLGDDTKIVIPSEHNGIKVTSIGSEAFAGSSIQSIYGGENIVSIQDRAFDSCYLLKEFLIDGNIGEIGNSAFYECISLSKVNFSEALTTIGYYAFENCTSLKEIELASQVSDLGFNVFKNCSSLEVVHLSDYIERIPAETFSGCTSLKKVEFPSSLTSIGPEAFSGCSRLSDVILPKTLTHIGDKAFINCNAIKSVTIPKNVTDMGSYCFNGNMKVIVEGTDFSWNSNWCSDDVIVEYLNKTNSKENVNIKLGNYKEVSGNFFQSTVDQLYLYFDDSSAEWLLGASGSLNRIEYEYEIAENKIYCRPRSSNWRSLELVYDETTNMMTMEQPGITYVFQWVGTEHPFD